MRIINPLVLLAGVASYIIMWYLDGERPTVTKHEVLIDYGTHGVIFRLDTGLVAYYHPGIPEDTMKVLYPSNDEDSPRSIVELYQSVRAVYLITKRIIKDIESEHG